MTRRRVRLALVGLAALVLVASAAVVAALTAPETAGQAMRAEAGEVPTALAGHLEQLRRSVPGNDGMAEEGPASAAEAEFLERAYPDDTISLAEMTAARSA